MFYIKKCIILKSILNKTKLMILTILETIKEYFLINPLAQIFWLIWLIFMVVWLYQKDENKLRYITWFWLGSFSIHFWLMELYIPALINLIAITRNLISIKYRNNLNAWLIMSVIYLSTLILNYTIQDLYIIWAALVVNYAYFMLEWVKFRSVILWSAIMWIWYWVTFHSLWWIITNLILWTTILISIIRLIIEKYRNINYIPNNQFVRIKIKD